MANLLTVNSYLNQGQPTFSCDGDHWIYENDLLVDGNGNKVSIKIPVSLLQEALDKTLTSNLNPSPSDFEEIGQSIAIYLANQLEIVQYKRQTT